MIDPVNQFLFNGFVVCCLLLGALLYIIEVNDRAQSAEQQGCCACKCVTHL